MKYESVREILYVSSDGKVQSMISQETIEE
jgi:hypothetical protein